MELNALQIGAEIFQIGSFNKGRVRDRWFIAFQAPSVLEKQSEYFQQVREESQNLHPYTDRDIKLIRAGE